MFTFCLSDFLYTFQSWLSQDEWSGKWLKNKPVRRASTSYSCYLNTFDNSSVFSMLEWLKHCNFPHWKSLLMTKSLSALYFRFWHIWRYPTISSSLTTSKCYFQW